MNERKRELAAVAVLFGALIAADVRAEQPSPSPKSDGAPGQAPGKGADGKALGQANRPGADKGKPDTAGLGKGKPGEPGTPAEAIADKGKPEDPNAKGQAIAAEHRAAGRGHSELRALRDELKAGKVKKEELEARLTKLRDTNRERQENHRAALKARWGENLAKAEAQQELKLHERRMARLNRILLLAQTEKKGKDAEKLSERIEKLVDQENARHEKRMAQISGAAAPAPGAPAAAVNEAVTK